MSDAKDTRILNWLTTWQPGELIVKGYKNGKEINHYAIKTAGEPYAIKAKADRNNFSLGKKQLAQIEINIVDKNGVPLYNADQEVTVTVEGPAVLLGLESGSLFSHEDYKATKRKTFNGRLLAYVQANKKPGTVKLTISSPGLQSQVIDLPKQ